MAFSIGSALSMDAITDNSFIEASEEIHLSFFSLLHPSPYKAQIESLEGRVSDR